MNNKIKQTKTPLIPTELNFYHNTIQRINKLRKQGNLSRVLILSLIVWDLVLTLNTIYHNQQLIIQEKPKQATIVIEGALPDLPELPVIGY